MCRRKSFKNYHVLSQLKYEALNFRDKDSTRKKYFAILKIFIFYIVIYTSLLASGNFFSFIELRSKN